MNRLILFKPGVVDRVMEMWDDTVRIRRHLKAIEKNTDCGITAPTMQALEMMLDTVDRMLAMYLRKEDD